MSCFPDTWVSARRETSNQSHSGFVVAEREGFEPSIRFWRILTFQASAFDHSATAPHCLEWRATRRGGGDAQGCAAMTVAFDIGRPALPRSRRWRGRRSRGIPAPFAETLGEVGAAGRGSGRRGDAGRDGDRGSVRADRALRGRAADRASDRDIGRAARPHPPVPPRRSSTNGPSAGTRRWSIWWRMCWSTRSGTISGCRTRTCTRWRIDWPE